MLEARNTYTFVAKIDCTKRRAVSVRKDAQHILPSIDLIKKQMNTPNVSSTSSILSTSSISSSSTQMRSNMMIAEIDNENPIDDDISENELTHSNAKQKDRKTINDNANLCKKS
ncbi:4297_t:CDS:2, partial [Cetraspora pellucida]